MENTVGRECRLGWGYDLSSNRLVSVEEDPPNVKKTQMTGNWKFIHSLSNEGIPSSETLFRTENFRYLELLKSPCIFLERSWKNFIDFLLMFDDHKYWLVGYSIYRQIESCEEVAEYPPNCDYFVDDIIHGVELWILFPQTEIYSNEDQVCCIDKILNR